MLKKRILEEYELGTSLSKTCLHITIIIKKMTIDSDNSLDKMNLLRWEMDNRTEGERRSKCNNFKETSRIDKLIFLPF